MLNELFTAAFFEEAINQALQLDPNAAEKLAVLEGYRIALRLEHLPNPWLFEIRQARFVIVDGDMTTADVRLTGTFSAFLQLFRTGKVNKHDKLYIEGDLHAAQALQQVLSALTLDFRKLLSERFGEKAGALLTDALERLQRFGEEQRQNIEAEIRRFFNEETGNYVLKTQFDIFIAELAQLEQKIAELEARLTHLEAGYDRNA